MRTVGETVSKVLLHERSEPRHSENSPSCPLLNKVAHLHRKHARFPQAWTRTSPLHVHTDGGQFPADYLWLHTFPVSTPPPLSCAWPGSAGRARLQQPWPCTFKSQVPAQRLVFPEATLAQDDRQSPTIHGRTATTPTYPTDSELTISPTPLPLANPRNAHVASVPPHRSGSVVVEAGIERGTRFNQSS